MIARIPLPPPSPMHGYYENDSREMSPSYYENGHEYRRRHAEDPRHPANSSEDAAAELERQVLDESSNVEHLIRFKGKDKDVGKRRQGSGAASDASSDFDVPFRGDRAGQGYKRRKIDKSAACIADDFERSLGNEPVSLSAVLKSSAAKRAKGKMALREGSQDSVSLTPKSARKKPMPKRKPDLAPDDVELAAHILSIEGDMTPAMSRHASPSPTVSSIIYEFDEVIPPLKKAKKLDDAAMLKRVKTLEENQRKVWTNIAKRDVSKVRTSDRTDSDVRDTPSGVPIPHYGLSSQGATARADCEICLCPCS